MISRSTSAHGIRRWPLGSRTSCQLAGGSVTANGDRRVSGPGETARDELGPAEVQVAQQARPDGGRSGPTVVAGSHCSSCWRATPALPTAGRAEPEPGPERPAERALRPEQLDDEECGNPKQAQDVAIPAPQSPAAEKEAAKHDERGGGQVRRQVKHHEQQRGKIGRSQDHEDEGGEGCEHACQAVHGLMLLQVRRPDGATFRVALGVDFRSFGLWAGPPAASTPASCLPQRPGAATGRSRRRPPRHRGSRQSLARPTAPASGPTRARLAGPR